MLYVAGTFGPPGAVHRQAHPHELDRNCIADGTFRGLREPPVRQGGGFDQGVRAADGQQSTVDFNYFNRSCLFVLKLIL